MRNFRLITPAAAAAVITASLLALPAQAATAPTHGAAVPTHGAAVPTHKAAAPTHKAAVPTHKAAVPTHKAAVPTHKASRPAHRAAVRHGVNWGDVTIPGQLCGTGGSIRLHDGRAAVRRSGYGRLDVVTSTVVHGNLLRGMPVTALQVWCDRPDGSAAAEGIIMFDAPHGRAHALGTLTSRNYPRGTSHIPYLTVAHIDTQGHVAVTEYWYTPSGLISRADTIWKWTGRVFIPGRTKITTG